MLDALIIFADVVADKRCAVSLTFDIIKRMRYDAAIVVSTRYSLSSYVLSVPPLTSVPAALLLVPYMSVPCHSPMDTKPGRHEIL